MPWARQVAALAFLAGSIACLLACGAAPPSEDVAEALHFDSIVVDTHADTTPHFQDPQWHFDERHRSGHVDLPRMREGGLDVQFWSIYMGKRPQPGSAIREALERMDAVHELVRRYPRDLAFAGSVAEIRRAVAQGKIACLMGIEGGHIIEESLPALRSYYRLGARYMTLTHSFNTSWADSAGTSKTPAPEHGGLTEFGEQVVHEMNRLGMMVDISHVSDDTFWDALRVSRAPLIASHSSVRAIANHPRNLSDEMLRALASKGGVVMINFYSGYLDPAVLPSLRTLYQRLEPQLAAIRRRTAGDTVARIRAMSTLFSDQRVPQTSLEKLLDHFDHAIAVAGPDHVGIGADFDGVISTPHGMDDVSHLPALTRGLLARGHSPEVVRNVLGENLLRVMAEVEAAAGS